ncbi:hypothetical protein QA600_18460 [Natronococcus sp. A-GB1]|uniref:HalOD1 output domain-containing protein n=1 Tax=Natronococcus sp. A-GB1 TaxID=3037648 RepID=UPI00241D30A2|nr:HalOD1 output domain-containing protein [Natronococcus sp. A-GB1]MDG5761316.1 hypothetical protein [Natronococcus sp. A-GB1]
MTYHTSFDPDDPPMLTPLIVTTIADLTDTPEPDLPLLYHAIDPADLDHLFTQPALDQFAVSFTYYQYQITIDHTGTITYTPQ